MGADGMNAVVNTDAAGRAQAEAANRLHQVADMTLHQLVDEFMSLTAAIKAGTTENPTTYSTSYSDDALVAIQNRNIVNGAIRARFGIEIDTFSGPF